MARNEAYKLDLSLSAATKRRPFGRLFLLYKLSNHGGLRNLPDNAFRVDRAERLAVALVEVVARHDEELRADRNLRAGIAQRVRSADHFNAARVAEGDFAVSDIRRRDARPTTRLQRREGEGVHRSESASLGYRRPVSLHR